MAKKTVRAAKPTQQRSKEEQWRKRMAAQARTGSAPYAAPGAAGSAVAEPDEDVETYESETYAQAPAAPAPRATTPRATSTAATSPARTSAAVAAQRRNLSAQRAVRPRAGITNTMSIEEEMHYIRADIRKLVILTAICIVIIIALAFVVPSVVK